VSALVSLFRAELRRFFSRRVMRGAFAFGIALSTFVLVIITVRSDVRTEREAGSSLICNEPSAPTTTTAGQLSIPNCVEQQNASIRRDHRIRLHDNFSGTVKGTGVAMVFIAFVIGASFIGAEFGAGSLSTQLIFEPRRTRLVAVKAVAVGVGLALMAMVLLVYIGLLQWAGSELRGFVGTIDGAWLGARAGDVLRVGAAVGLAGVIAYAITIVARRTVAAVAALLIVGWASAIIGNVSSWRWVAKYNPATALISFALDPSHHNLGRDELTVKGAAVATLIWAVGLTVVSAILFNRREVR
jgi:hypothetical protein